MAQVRGKNIQGGHPILPAAGASGLGASAGAAALVTIPPVSILNDLFRTSK